jgi:activator of HSP90 ATPase
MLNFGADQQMYGVSVIIKTRAQTGPAHHASLSSHHAIPTPVPQLFAAFTDARMMQAYTQAPATCDANVGGKFSLFGGSLNGEFQEIVRPHVMPMK